MTGIDRPLFRRIAALALSTSLVAFGIAGMALAEEAPETGEAPKVAVAEASVARETPIVTSNNDGPDAFVDVRALNGETTDGVVNLEDAETSEERASCEEVRAENAKDFVEVPCEGTPLADGPSEDIPIEGISTIGDAPVMVVPLVEDALRIDGVEAGVEGTSTSPEGLPSQDTQETGEVSKADALDSPDEPVESGSVIPAEPMVLSTPSQPEPPTAPVTPIAPVADPAAVSTSEVALFSAAAPMGTWVVENGSTYYRLPDGTNQTGRLQIDGDWYYLDPSANGARATGMQELDADAGTALCLFGADGKQRFGEAFVDGAWCYFDPDHMGAQSHSSLSR